MKFIFSIFSLVILLPLGATAWQFDKTKILTKAELKKTLTPLQFEVTQAEGTETPFKNEFWSTKEDGIYVDVISGEPLFSSKDKFDSGTGWPSFFKILVKENVIEKVDKKLFSQRTEVRSKHANSHLGHVFTDGPLPTGLRYCLNSASLKFIPKAKLKELGYEEFLNEFSESLQETAVFAGGCFWCMQPPFDALKSKGVISTRVGYSGGKKENPTYAEVSSGDSGHLEVIEITFNPKKISFKELLNTFWKNIDPLNDKGQFCDNGKQYLSALLYVNESQKIDFENSIKDVEKLGLKKDKIVTTTIPLNKFYPAEDYHQAYYEKNPIKYKLYRYNCGRDKRLKEIWGTSPHD